MAASACVAQAKNFYCSVLGASPRANLAGALGGAGSCMLGFGPEGGVAVELVQLPAGVAVDHAAASGRFATETEDGAPAAVGAALETKGGGTILHGPLKLQPHGEEVLIAQDCDGHEYCFVDARGYRNCIAVGARQGGTVIDWAYRERLAAAALSGKGSALAVARVLAGEYDAAAVKARIAEYTAAPVLVFSQTTCPYCKKSKELLQQLGARFQTVELDALGAEGCAATRPLRAGLCIFRTACARLLHSERCSEQRERCMSSG